MDRRTKERLKDLLAIPRGEAQAWVVVIAIIVGLAGWITYQQVFAKPGVAGLEKEQAVLDAWLAERSQADSVNVRSAELFAFDPNHLPLDQWQRLGLSEKQAQAIHRYEERGGRFRSKADLARMRVIRPELYARWVPFIQLPDSAPSASRPWNERKDERTTWQRDTASRYMEDREGGSRLPLVEVNTCDTTQLIALPGIGPSFARGIVKYREQLGGYVSLDQLAEVFVLKDKPDAVEKLKTLLVLDTLMVRRIRINTCAVEELATHPYARWKVAKPLIAYRQQHGPFKDVEGIKGCAMITEEVYRQLAPYLIVE